MRRLMTQDPHAKRPVWWIPLLLSGFLSVAIGMTRDCSHNDKVIAERMTRVEQKVDDNAAHSKDKIDHIQDQVDKIYYKLLDWEKK